MELPWSIEGATLGVSGSATGGGGTGTTGLDFAREHPSGAPARTATEEFTADIVYRCYKSNNF